MVGGVTAAFRGLGGALKNPDVRRTYGYLVTAIYVTTLVLDVLGIWGVWVITEAHDAGWLTDVMLIILRIAGIAVVLLAAPIVSVFAVNLAVPLLAEKVFYAALGSVNADRARELMAREGLGIRAGIGLTIRRLGAFLLSTLLAFALTFIPVAGPFIGPVAQTYVAARFLGWELLDPYFDKMQIPLADQRRFLRDHRDAVVGFALPFTFLLAIPILGPLLAGLAQAAAARLVSDVLEAPG